jgi:hypothetical protein
MTAIEGWSLDGLQFMLISSSMTRTYYVLCAALVSARLEYEYFVNNGYSYANGVKLSSLSKAGLARGGQ